MLNSYSIHPNSIQSPICLLVPNSITSSGIGPTRIEKTHCYGLIKEETELLFYVMEERHEG